MNKDTVDKDNENRMPIIFENEGKWYFWDETGTATCGPYDTDTEAREKLAAYCAYLASRWTVSTAMTIAGYIARQIRWSEKVFGSSVRTMGITKHIEKEIAEIRAAPHDLSEWCDIMILAFDGAWRAGYTPEQIAEGLERKWEKNLARTWPPLSEVSPDEPSEHIEEEEEPRNFN